MRRPVRLRRSGRGFALVVFFTLLVAGALAFLVSTLGPEAMEAYRVRKTEAAMAQAREALLGYAVRFRDVVSTNDVYGFLPLPDLGTSRNNNAGSGCQGEGCDAGNFAGGGSEITVIGRFPWRLMGMEPIRDGHGECRWYAVSGSHKRTQPLTPMNWDTLGELNVVVANAGGVANLTSMIASAHDRPVAIIFSPGPAMAGQDRSASADDTVTQCGGNYDVANYLAPETAGALAGVTNYFAGATNNASGYTRDQTDDIPPGPNNNKSLYTQGRMFLRAADNTLWPGACPAGTNCPLAADDRGLALTTGDLFGALRKNANFRVDLSSLLDRMWGCVRDFIAAGGSAAPQGIPDYVEPGDKTAGRFPDHACYSNLPPIGYFANWQDMYYFARPRTGFPDFLVNVDGVDQSCKALLIFAGQRGPGQSRVTLAERSNLANYLEGSNLASFTGLGRTFSGQSTFGPESATQLAQQDIVRCVPTINTESFVTVGSPELTAEGFPQIVGYDPGSRTLTLGREGVTTNDDAPAGALFGCAWTPEANPQGKGFRAYFTFQFREVGSSVGNNGFVFAAVDADTNPLMICGAAGSHLGYSGDNGVTPPLTPAKIGIEFDQGRNSGFSESANLAIANPGRNDPCGATPSGPTIPPDCSPPYVGYNSHAAIVYWGHEYQNSTDDVTRPQDDDNVHGYPTTGSQSAYPHIAPQNPGDINAATPGIAFVNMRDQSSEGDNSYLYHVRVEVDRVGGYAELSPLVPEARAAATSLADLGSPGATLGGVDLAAGDRVLLTAQTDSADNGIYVWQGPSTSMLRAADADSASELSYAALRVTEGSGVGYWQQIAQVLNVGGDPQLWRFHSSQPIASGSNFQIRAWIESDSLTKAQLIAAMQDTTRSMDQLYPMRREAACGVGNTCPSGQSCSLTDSYCYRPNIPTLSSTAKVYDVAGLACGAGGSCAPGYACGTDNICYRQGLRSVRLGFTGSQRTQDQQVLIRNFFASWLQ
ncbi:MAG: hypothetical protein HZC22_17000 [Rhodocyclales bacterium]|nr:hypothetical protein [Rhodocyclales bacterium]